MPVTYVGNLDCDRDSVDLGSALGHNLGMAAGPVELRSCFATDRLWSGKGGPHHLARFAHVHVLYKRPEIPANTGVLAIVVSATYRKHVKAANPGSIPVSATNSV